MQHDFMGACRHEQGGGDLLPPEMLYSILCISSYSKTLSRRIIYALFHILLSASGAFTPGHSGAPSLGHRWGTFVPRPLICPPLEKVPQAPMRDFLTLIS